MEEYTTKCCGVCGAEKPLTEFYRSFTRKGGFSYRCKACDFIARQRSKSNPNRRPRKLKTRLDPGDSKSCNVCGLIKLVEEFRKENRNYGDGYYNQCHDCERGKGRAWNKLRRNYRREYDVRNRERLYAQAREWRERNRDKYMAHRRKHWTSPKGRLYNRNKQAIRRSRSKSGDVTTKWLAQFMESQRYCFYCHKPFNSKRKKTVDHVIPLDKGGEHIMSNLVIACQPCNSRKQDRLVMLI